MGCREGERRYPGTEQISGMEVKRNKVDSPFKRNNTSDSFKGLI